MILILITAILIVVFVVAVIDSDKEFTSRQEDYLEECEKQKHKEKTNH